MSPEILSDVIIAAACTNRLSTVQFGAGLAFGLNLNLHHRFS